MYPDFKLSANQAHCLLPVVEALVVRYQPVSIYCFGYRQQEQERKNCFMEEISS